MARMNNAKHPAKGHHADGFEPVAEVFAEQLRSGQEVGAAFAVYWKGECVVDLWGGVRDVQSQVPWDSDTRVLLFSVTKGLASMALAMLADRGLLDWDGPVASVWPEFGSNGKSSITFRTLFAHRGGLPGLARKLKLADCLSADVSELETLLAQQRPFWQPGSNQGYHAVTFGMYARAVFERIAHESIGKFLSRELFAPLSADVSLGTPAMFDEKMARLIGPTPSERLKHLLRAILRGGSNETRVAHALILPSSPARSAMLNPAIRSPVEYDQTEIRRAELAWVGATGTAHGVARAYLPFALGGEYGGRRYLRERSVTPVYDRQSWSERDLVLQKPIGWSQGFLKEETTLFSPHRESFGHAGVGGALGWCDPVLGLTIGYTPNHLDWRVRSPRAVALCQALYRCEPLRGPSA